MGEVFQLDDYRREELYLLITLSTGTRLGFSEELAKELTVDELQPLKLLSFESFVDYVTVPTKTIDWNLKTKRAYFKFLSTYLTKA